MNVFLIAAVSKDGFLADKTDQTSLDWTSKEDKQFFRDRTKQAGVMVMGSTTYRTIGRPLPGRITIVMTTHPETIPDSKPLNELPQYQIPITPAVYTTDLNPREVVEKLTHCGYPVIAICGGSTVYTQWMASGVVTTLYVTEEDVTFGQGIPLFTTPFPLPPPTAVTPLSPQTTLYEYTLHPTGS